ncbi:MAG: hypothetical protein FWD43_00135 [Coriobacteriia bacterium]|nr:hypothetical protein [Coriobacteriia bacterium]
MAMIDIKCAQCGSGEYRLLDPKTGEVVCPFCRNQWIVPALIQKTATEKFLEEQAKQPRVTVVSSNETDDQLLKMLSGAMGCGNAFKNVINRIAFIIILIITLLIALGVCAAILQSC